MKEKEPFSMVIEHRVHTTERKSLTLVHGKSKIKKSKIKKRQTITDEVQT